MSAPFEEIADVVGTPVYVYDADLLRARIARLEAALADAPHVTCYALKANDALAVLSIVASAGLGADIVSGGELFKATHAGIPAGRIVYSGVGKTTEEIRAALAAGVRSLNVESAAELDAIAAAARALGVVAPVSIRVNPDVEADTHAYIATGSAATKFGVPLAEAADAVRRAAADPALEPVGLSFHVGSQLLDPSPVLAAAAKVADLWRALAADGIALRDLDCGGGLGVPYVGGPELDVEAYAAGVAGVARALGATLVLEPGRWLVAPIGTLLTRVVYVKESAGRTIAICDAGMNDLLRPALYQAHHPIEVLAADGRPTRLVDVVGPICESGDFLALGRHLPEVAQDDLLAVGYAGAYGRVMSSTYNAHRLCAEVLVEAGGWRVTRARQAYVDLLRNETT
ncbi:MAG: diaminopimelate decarboxylase [Thermoleophilia bacterium]